MLSAKELSTADPLSANAGAAMPTAITEPAMTAATFEYFTGHPFSS
jgi:hypothetical protein